MCRVRAARRATCIAVAIAFVLSGSPARAETIYTAPYEDDSGVATPSCTLLVMPDPVSECPSHYAADKETGRLEASVAVSSPAGPSMGTTDADAGVIVTHHLEHAVPRLTGVVDVFIEDAAVVSECGLVCLPDQYRGFAHVWFSIQADPIGCDACFLQKRLDLLNFGMPTWTIENKRVSIPFDFATEDGIPIPPGVTWFYLDVWVYAGQSGTTQKVSASVRATVEQLRID